MPRRRFSPGAAGLVRVETSAFIAADAVFCLIGLAGGVMSGALGYLLAVRRYGPVAMAGVLASAFGAAYLARWVGEHSGLATFHHLLATRPAGARLRDSLTPRDSGALASWPLAAGPVAGGMTTLTTRGPDGAARAERFLTLLPLRFVNRRHGGRGAFIPAAQCSYPRQAGTFACRPGDLRHARIRPWAPLSPLVSGIPSY